MLQRGHHANLLQKAIDAEEARHIAIQHFDRDRSRVLAVSVEYTVAIPPRPSTRSTTYRPSSGWRRESAMTDIAFTGLAIRASGAQTAC